MKNNIADVSGELVSVGSLFPNFRKEFSKYLSHGGCPKDIADTTTGMYVQSLNNLLLSRGMRDKVIPVYCDHPDPTKSKSGTVWYHVNDVIETFATTLAEVLVRDPSKNIDQSVGQRGYDNMIVCLQTAIQACPKARTSDMYIINGYRPPVSGARLSAEPVN